jgi:uncharacterized protein
MWQVEHIFIYPIKSLGGIELTSSKVEKRGLAHDRRYMLVDEHGQFITQRVVHHMALLKVAIEENALKVHATGHLGSESWTIPLALTSGNTIKVKVWDDEVEGITADQDTNNYFSRMLGMACRLVYMPDSTSRLVDKKYAEQGDITSFSDAYPILLIGTKSLEDLNQRLEQKLGWDRFRPNVVVKTQVPFEEDQWKRIKINDTLLDLVKPCSRCVLTTVDQQTATAGKEPLRTLATYRQQNNKIMFGQNVIARNEGTVLRKGDKVELLR